MEKCKSQDHNSFCTTPDLAKDFIHKPSKEHGLRCYNWGKLFDVCLYCYCRPETNIPFSGEKPYKQPAEPSSAEVITKVKRNGLLDEGQRTLILKTLKINNWNFTRTAEDLGIGRTTLWRKVKKYNLKDESLV